MDAKKIAEQLRLAFRDSGLTLWEVARRAELGAPDVAAALGHSRRPAVDLVEAVGYALGLELAFTPLQATTRGAVDHPPSVVDLALAKCAPERAAAPPGKSIKVLALDLEATLVSSDSSATARPGLFEFLEACQALFERVVVFAAVDNLKFRELAIALVRAQLAPPWLVTAEVVHWSGFTKDLNFVQGVMPDEVLLVDDTAQYVHPGQEAQWVRIKSFEPALGKSDDELLRVIEVLADRVVGRR